MRLLQTVVGSTGFGVTKTVRATLRSFLSDYEEYGDVEAAKDR